MMDNMEYGPAVPYRYIRAWGKYWRTPQDHVEWLVAKATEEGAPQDVIDLVSPTDGVREWKRWCRDDVEPGVRAEVEKILREMKPVLGEIGPEADSHINIFGSGAIETYSWWLDYEESWEGYDPPDGWVVILTGGEAAEEDVGVPEDSVTKKVTHEMILRTARAICHPDSHIRVGQGTRNQCWRLLIAPDECDFDADMADSLLQVLMFDEIRYG